MFKIAPFVKSFRFEKKGIFCSGSKQLIMEDLSFWEAVTKIAFLWKEPKSVADISIAAQKYFPSMSISVVNKAINYLQKNHFLINQDDFIESERYSRNHLYYKYLGGNVSDIQSRLEGSTVSIIGCGGIGNHVSAILASSGVGKLVLVDDDTIELSNLTRQILFDEASVGKKKIDILAKELGKRNSLVYVEKKPLKITSIKDIEELDKTDLFVLSADSPPLIGDWFNTYCVKNKIPYISVGYVNDISVFGPFYIPSKSSCIRCKSVIPWEHDHDDPMKEYFEEINAGFRPATFPAVNATAAAMASGDILKFLGNYGEILSLNKRVGIHSSVLKIETQEIEKNPNCSVCGIL